MNVLHVSYAFPVRREVIPDGVTSVLYNMTHELAKRGHHITVCVSLTSVFDAERISSLRRMMLENGIEVYYFPYSIRFANFCITPRIVSFCLREIRKFNLIHIHDARAFQSMIVAFFAWLFRIPYVVQPHGAFFSPLPKSTIVRLLRSFLDMTISRRIVENCSRILVLSVTEAEEYLDHGVKAERITVIRNGIDVTEYENLPKRGRFRERHNIAAHNQLVLCLGRIHEIKGIDVLVRAFARLVKHMRYIGAMLAIVGPDHGYLITLKALIKELEMEKQILILSPIYARDKLEAYVDSDICIIPSIYETFSMVLLEACVCGRPVIASRVGGLKDLVLNNDTGLLVEPGNVVQLVNSMVFMLDDPNRAKAMGLRGREYVCKNFSIERAVDEIVTLYASIGSKRARAEIGSLRKCQ